jgi:hypothetical protein
MKNAWKTALVIGLALLPLFFAACPGEQSSVPYYPQTPSSLKTTISGTVSYQEAGTTVPVSKVYAGSAPVWTEATGLGEGTVSANAYRLQITRPAAARTVYFFVQPVMSFVKVPVGQAVIPAGAATAAYDIAYNRQFTTISGTVSLTVDGSPAAPDGVVFSSSPTYSMTGGGILGSGTVSGSGPYTYTGDITRPATATTVYVFVSGGSVTTLAGQITIPANATAVTENITCTVLTTLISGNFEY